MFTFDGKQLEVPCPVCKGTNRSKKRRVWPFSNECGAPGCHDGYVLTEAGIEFIEFLRRHVCVIPQG